jgi:hypothetical protein
MGQIKRHAFLPAGQNPAKPLHPTVGALYDLKPRLEAGFPLEGLRFFTTCPAVRPISERLRQLANFLSVVTLVRAEILRLLRRRIGTWDAKGF